MTSEEMAKILAEIDTLRNQLIVRLSDSIKQHKTQCPKCHHHTFEYISTNLGSDTQLFQVLDGYCDCKCLVKKFRTNTLEDCQFNWALRQKRLAKKGLESDFVFDPAIELVQPKWKNLQPCPNRKCNAHMVAGYFRNTVCTGGICHQCWLPVGLPKPIEAAYEAIYQPLRLFMGMLAVQEAAVIKAFVNSP